MSGLGRSIVLSLTMLAAAGAAAALVPTRQVRENTIDLERAIPVAFADWKIDPTIVPVAPSPDVEKAIEKIYAQTLSRTYVNAAGARIMLSMAYGTNQSDALRLHQPEGCYVGQGFQIDKAMSGIVKTLYGDIRVRQLIATKGFRHEPITYWIVVGDRRVVSNWEQKVVQLSYGLTGRIPDGILVRVSSISSDDKSAFALQDRFVQDLLRAVGDEHRAQLIGKL
jgi:EpsI family protein